MRKILAIAALCLLATPAFAGSRKAPPVQMAGPLTCGLIFNWEAPYCSTGSILFGSIFYGALIGTGVGAIAAGGTAFGTYAATHSTAQVIGAGAAVGAGTGLLLPVVLRR